MNSEFTLSHHLSVCNSWAEFKYSHHLEGKEKIELSLEPDIMAFNILCYMWDLTVKSCFEKFMK